MKMILSSTSSDYGFTQQEAEAKIPGIEKAFKVNRSDSIWKPAKLVPDPDKKSGYMVVIESI